MRCDDSSLIVRKEVTERKKDLKLIAINVTR